ncbi:aerobic-type carbon monoxide dehydrogenase, large subunit CoxL/CutL-like protein [Cylindrospermum stagnale PCC 7417]|uniref:Aerobic-type carbon monoxide dehydrogenase, large subunit CoxL/CutL-like protein n=1 Tax=Cylindrospermum stagnale PCC 7417 TaxID=56107 RepID=K9WWR0_9NOST|nr:molybdopterin cofactor-binding domain-containing protein [Cylindrospermum stagnale]AFZ24628.1 aerobic-type carbon monoxide dehydrogenase, large subunit CoxL/CutL-like protein [Cylindrospermum stagnale PCC 7417]
MAEALNFKVNNQSYSETCHPGTSLLSLLRQLGWFGVHRVCDTGDCGACTVWVNDVPIHSCIYPAMRIANKSVTTIEGLSPNDELAPMQQAFLEAQGFQCGFCTPGMMMSAAKLPKLSEADLRLALKGNFCRCTGYQAIIESILLSQNSELKTQNSFVNSQQSVGKNVPKQDGAAIVTGKASYTGDISPPGLLHLQVFRSPFPHAHIRKIDTEQAKKLPGVVAIFTHADVPRIAYTTAGHAEPVPDPLDHYLLDHTVRFIGDRIAAVVAESPSIAAQACELITVDYEILPHVTHPVAAINSEVVIHDEPESSQIADRNRNIAGQIFLESGDLAQGFALADLIVENTYNLPAVQHVHLEPHVTLSWLEADGTLVVRSSTQVPFHCQRLLSQILNYPQDKIRVYKAQLGGGFGNKQEILSEDLCAFATLKTGKPVQWEFSRNEEFTATNSRHAMTIKLKTGVQADGKIVAQDMEIIGNTGAYGNHGQTVVFLAGYIPLGLYRCPNKRLQAFAVYTNTMPAGAFRGYGATQGTFAMESQIDEIAQKLNIDPIAIRLKNLIRPGDIISVGNSQDHFNLIGSYAVIECWEKVIQSLGYIPGTPPIVAGSRRRGVGFAVSMQGSGLSKIHIAKVKLSRLAAGKYELRTGSVDVGTGSDTTLQQIAAEALKVTVADINIIAGDTQETPFDAGSYASATIYISGQAVKLAAEKLLNTDETSVELSYAADESTLTFAVQGVEVEVDTETGKVKVLRCVQAIDLGKAINPRICQGQATGGIAMGIGYALTEELLFDTQGRILNPTLREYRIPTAADMPPIEVILVEKADPYGPYGAKGVGEITTNCTAPAITNAIFQATGCRLYQLPMTPERIWQKLNNPPT